MSPVDGAEAGGDGFGLSATLEWIKMVPRSVAQRHIGAGRSGRHAMQGENDAN